MASTMSGMIIGAKIRDSSQRPLRARISMPMARSVPRIVASVADTSATIRVFSAAFRMSALPNNAPYHFSENPVHAVGSPPSLNDNATNTEIGIYRNANTAPNMVNISGRLCIGAFHRQRLQQQQPHHDRDQHHRQRGPKGPVVRG